MARTYNGRFYAPEQPKSGTGWLIAGLVLMPSWPSFITLIASVACFVKFGKIRRENRLYKRFHEYCAVIGMRGRVPVRELKSASPAGTGVGDVRRDLQEMISRGYFGREAYIDLARNELVISDAAGAEAPRGESAWDRAEREGLRGSLDALAEMLSALGVGNRFQSEVRDDEWASRAQAGDFDYEEVSYQAKRPERPTPRTAAPKDDARAAAAAPKGDARAKVEPKPRKRTYAEELESTLNELYQLNEKIEDEAVSQRIDHIGTLTAGIFRAVIERPEREQDVRKFMNYYLPTTLKLLRSYDMLEDQRCQSQNIVESRKKIENVLDMLIQAFGRLLDRLYKDDALDIATDIDVLETMMAGDGLASKQELPL